MKTPSKRQVKAWAIVHKKKQIIVGVGDTYDLSNRFGIYFEKPPRSAVYPDEILIPCIITYQLPKKRGVKK